MSKRLTTEQFVEQAKEKHGNTYDYSKVEYVNAKTEVEIICKEHGSFFMSPNAHKSGHGCSDCAITRRSLSRVKSLKSVIEKFKNVHGNRYDYSDVIYKTTHTKVDIICKEHGTFKQTPNSHNRGRGCPECDHTKSETTQSCIAAFVETHGNMYDYSKVQYNGNFSPVEVICEKHGSFWPTPSNHKQNTVCPKCMTTVSKPEIEISEYLESLGVKVERNVRGLFKNLNFEADIFLPEQKIVIEYDGLIWHSEMFSKDLHNVKNKTQMANDAGYRCIHIREDQYLENPDLIKSLLKSALGLFDNKIGARETQKRDITIEQYKEFCSNHLHGYRPSKHKKGLFYKNELVACIGYNDTGELIRYVVKNNWLVLGALPKLLKTETVTFSFCDLSFFTGESYNKSGFKLEYITKPNYIYIKRLVIRSRQQMMKHKLSKILEYFDNTLTEVENCNNNGWYRLFDAGNAKYTLAVLINQ